MKKIITSRKYAIFFLTSIFVLVLASLIIFCRSFNSIIFFIIYCSAIVLAIIMIKSALYPFYLKWNQGAIGEEIVINELKKLEKEYIIEHDVKLPGQKFGNIDHIVIGKNGVFLIETKSHKGHIICQGDIWIQQKYNRKGIQYEKKMKSPSIQTKKYAKLLRQFFREKFPKLSNVWVYCIVVFTDKHTTLEYNDPTIYVLKIDKLNESIKNFNFSLELSDDDFSKLKILFKKLKSKYGLL